MKPLSRKIANHKNYYSHICNRDIIQKIEKEHGVELEAFVWNNIRYNFSIRRYNFSIRYSLLKIIIYITENEAIKKINTQ